MNVDLTGKRILVTGAGQGIGRALCIALAERTGATVFALSKSKERLASLAEAVPGIQTVTVDLRDREKSRAAVEPLLPIDGLVNNAGVSILGDFLQLDLDEIDKIFEVNVKAMVNISQVVARGLKDSRTPGAIVNVSSQASQAALPSHLAYCGSKAALDMMSKVMALELAPFNIRVNCVNPTVVLTDMGRIAWSDPSKSKAMLDKIPLGKFAEEEDVVNGILFLLSDKAARMITGITLPIDGGFLAV